MGDFKSKLPDFKEFSSMAGKLFNDVKKSVCEIIGDYKKKREEEIEIAKTEKEKPSVKTKEEIKSAEVRKEEPIIETDRITKEKKFKSKKAETSKPKVEEPPKE